ncbi:hypothetical protein GCM10018779_52860 [Streptomyces griseocarneus]|nr:hypothetical protein GCM10018779_52860 [Streptomyces griseocarneus]
MKNPPTLQARSTTRKQPETILVEIGAPSWNLADKYASNGPCKSAKQSSGRNWVRTRRVYFAAEPPGTSESRRRTMNSVSKRDENARDVPESNDPRSVLYTSSDAATTDP